MRLHSLREIGVGVYTMSGQGGDPIDELPAHDPTQMQVTRTEALDFRRWLHECAAARPADRERSSFVAHFQWFDSLSKEATERIPFTDLAEVEALLRQYFPDGAVVW